MVDYFGSAGNNYRNGTDFEASGTISLYHAVPAADMTIACRQDATHSSYGKGTEFVRSAN